MRSSVVLAVCALLGASAPVAAECDRDWHAGVNLRTEFGTHPVRIDGGARFGRLDLILVLDPMFWTDGAIDVDLLATWRLSSAGWGALGGWRPSSIGLDEGRQFQHGLVLGFVGPLPRLGPIRVSWGFEVVSILVKHGGGLPTDTIGTDLGDDINLGMFVRFDHASSF